MFFEPPAPNTDTYDDRSTELLAVTWVLCSFGIAFVALRLYSRLTITKELRWDDFFIVLSLVCLAIPGCADISNGN